MEKQLTSTEQGSQSTGVRVQKRITGSIASVSSVVNINSRLLPILLLALGLILWLLSLRAVPLRQMNDLGLLSVLPPLYYCALIVLIGSFCMILANWPDWDLVLALHVILLILILHATPAILYGTLRYTWAWKHVGIVDYILRHGQVNPNIDFLPVYHNWPGFFVFNAMLVQMAGLTSALDYANWAPPFFNLLFFGGLFLIYRALTEDRRLIWLSIWCFFLTSWVGQDYFAPQAFDYFFYLVVVGLLLFWFRPTEALNRARGQFWEKHTKLASIFGKILPRQASPLTPPTLLPFQRAALMGAAILLLIVITVSHPLTPLIVVTALCLLTLFRQVSSRGLLILFLVLESAWVWFAATPFTKEMLGTIFSSFGDVAGHVTDNLVNLSDISPGQAIVAEVGRGLTILVIFLALVGFLRRWKYGHFDLAAVLLTLAPVSALVGVSYGGEILFRVYFFALPFMAFYIGALFFPDPRSQTTWLTPLLASLLSITLLGGLLFAYYGKENQYYFTPQEVEAAEYLYNFAPSGSLIVEGSRNYPALFHDYETYHYVPIYREPVEVRQKVIQHPVEVLSSWMGNLDYPAAYLIITRSQKADINEVGEMSHGSLEAIEGALQQSGRFVEVYRNQDAVIFALRSRGK